MHQIPNDAPVGATPRGCPFAGRKVRVSEVAFAVPDHNIPIRNQLQPIKDPVSARQVENLRRNCKDFGG